MGSGIYKFCHFKTYQIYMLCNLRRGTYRITVGWCFGGCCGGRMHYPKVGYWEKVKAIEFPFVELSSKPYSDTPVKDGVCYT